MHVEELRLKRALAQEVRCRVAASSEAGTHRLSVAAGSLPLSHRSRRGSQPLPSCLPTSPLRPAHAATPQVRLDTGEAELRQVAALWAAQPHIDAARVRDTLYIVAATAERRRL